MKRFVLLDRDGTLIVERNYLSQACQVELVRGAAEGLRRMAALGLGLAVITNQSGVARHYFDLPRLAEIHARLRQTLEMEGVSLDGIYYCPHHPEDDCDCRKPRPGLVFRAARELGFDPAQAFLIGDKPCDIQLGEAIGAVTFLVRSGYGRQYEAAGQLQPDYAVDDLVSAAEVIQSILLRSSAGLPTIPPTPGPAPDPDER